MAGRGRPRTIFDVETAKELRIRRAAAFLINPLRAFLPALDATEDAKTLPGENARNSAAPSDKKTRYQTFLLAVQKVRHRRRLSKLDTVTAVRHAVAELQYVRREVIREELQQEIEECVAKIRRALL